METEKSPISLKENLSGGHGRYIEKVVVGLIGWMIVRFLIRGEGIWSRKSGLELRAC
jgi:hypothetical protein